MEVMAVKARPQGGHGPLTHLMRRLTNLSQCECHSDALPAVSLLLASSCQEIQPQVAAYFRNSSSHRNQRVRPALRSCSEGGNVLSSSSCPSKSLHSVVLFASLVGSIRMTLPAQHHLLRRCARIQNLMPASLACLRAMRVERFTQSIQSSSGALLGPAILLNMWFWVDLNNRFSACVISQESLHQSKICETLASNSFGRFRTLPSRLPSNGQSWWNLPHAAATRFLSSTATLPDGVKVVTRILKPTDEATTGTILPSMRKSEMWDDWLLVWIIIYPESNSDHALLTPHAHL